MIEILKSVRYVVGRFLFPAPLTTISLNKEDAQELLDVLNRYYSLASARASTLSIKLIKTQTMRKLELLAEVYARNE